MAKCTCVWEGLSGHSQVTAVPIADRDGAVNGVLCRCQLVVVRPHSRTLEVGCCCFPLTVMETWLPILLFPRGPHCHFAFHMPPVLS